MGYVIKPECMDEILKKLAESYKVYAPRFDARKKDVRFKEIESIGQIVTDRQSDFSAKEVYYPISQVMFYFREDRMDENLPAPEKDILIFGRACDINAIKRLDNVFLKNGGAADAYYKRMREHVKFVLMECMESFENCFCVSVGSNVAEDYAFAVRIEEDRIFADVKEADFEKYFAGAEAFEYKVKFVEENEKKLEIPEINRDNLKEISDLEFWKEFDEKCIGCAGCNTVCGTCSCFDTVDVTYDEGSNDGERRRVWSGCMLQDFTRTAGGALSRKTKGANMRFKVLHKFYDYKDRFGDTNMCVGCGRCDLRCPKEISFFDTVNGLTGEIGKK